ncbi:MAG: methyltransferase domain-containing protein [Verrucomicrobia bacterium]|nr:methyltransferase domain-containing protein [Verrucomicrobiota bacterium]
MMTVERLREALQGDRDELWDRLYPQRIQELSRSHWTPLRVARLAAEFLVQSPGTRVLDIGCGPGKFCLAGALTSPGHFTGIEQRPHLHQVAQSTAAFAPSDQITFHCGNITQVEFAPFDAFYLYNPFEENLETLMRIDDSLSLRDELYDEYIEYVAGQLARAPLGTRVATYCGLCEEIPLGYDAEESPDYQRLKLWRKVRQVPLRERKSEAAVR